MRNVSGGNAEERNKKGKVGPYVCSEDEGIHLCEQLLLGQPVLLIRLYIRANCDGGQVKSGLSGGARRRDDDSRKVLMMSFPSPTWTWAPAFGPGPSAESSAAFFRLYISTL
jgi:hypothetical protein